MKNKLGLGYIGLVRHGLPVDYFVGIVQQKNLSSEFLAMQAIRKEQTLAKEHREKYYAHFGEVYIIGHSNLVRKYSYDDFIKHHKEILDKVSKLSSTERKRIIQTYQEIYG